jgi:formate-dependent nitrite reductase membrane component NrfD
MPEPEAQRAPYGRHIERRAAAGEAQPYAGETYYGRPALKKSTYGWQIIVYFLVGGIAGAAQIIATIADLAGRRDDRPVVRAGRYVALLGTMLSPILLIADLHAPARWYNMLRIFRKTSAMSIGSWTLSIFGALSGLVAVAQAAGDLLNWRAGRTLARLFGLPAAAAGAMMTVYTGTLLAATSVPFWAAAGRRLSALFGLSATASASATLSLVLTLTGARREAHTGLSRIALLASGAELALAAATDQAWRANKVDAPLRRQPLALLYWGGALGLGIVLPLVLHLITFFRKRESRTLAVLAASATIAGGLAQRAVIVLAGNESATRPEDYFRFTQAPKDEL